MKKLVSVIIPSCNDGKYLEKSINSILAQTYGNIEIIVIDSSDDLVTLDILKKYKDMIKCFYEPKRGIAAALNVGLDRAKGEYIARMDADDISLPQRISMQVEYMENHTDIGLLGTQCDVIDENGYVVGEIDPGYYLDSEIKAKLIFENCIIHPTVMMRAGLINKGWRYEEGHYAEDLRLWMQLAVGGVKFANLKEHLLLYRRSETNMSSDSYKVAPSAAASAKEYAEAMFGLRIGKYEPEDFTRPYYTNIITKSKAAYISKQLELLKDINIGNIKKGIIQQIHLVKELNNRWRWVFEMYGKDVTQLCRKEVFCPDTDDTELFYDEIMKKLHILDEKTLLSLVNDIITTNERFSKMQKNECKTLVIYGIGKRGKELLNKYERKYNSGEIKWELVAVSDAKRIEVVNGGKNLVTISQEELVELDPDIVIISSDKYFKEIYKELKEKGLKSKILDNSWIL